jgi:hypothetical protein
LTFSLKCYIIKTTDGQASCFSLLCLFYV